MFRAPFWIQSLVYIAVLVLVGCSDSNENKSTQQSDPHADHEHAEVGPHHGQLVELGHEEYHAEWTFDNSSGKVTIYLLDAEAKEEVTTTAEKITVKATRGKITNSYELAAINTSDTEPPATSQFQVVNAEMLELIKLVDHGIKATLSVSIDGKQYTGSFEHLPHDSH